VGQTDSNALKRIKISDDNDDDSIATIIIGGGCCYGALLRQ
jgi:hypothetical protein